MLIYHLDFNYTAREIDFVRRQLDFAAAHGYNAVLWELEDQVRWRTCPECAHTDSWSQDEFRELLDYSRQLGLEPIPLLQTIGHAEYVLKHEKYFPYREDPRYNDCYCPSNPEVRIFIKKWLDEYCGLFGSLKYFHLGGDEAYRFGSCAACSAVEPNFLYGDYISDIAKTLQEKDIRPGVWGDMTLQHRESVGNISRDFVIWDWMYSSDYEYESAEFLKSKGFEIIVCSAARSSVDGPFTPKAAVHAVNILKAEKTRRRLGLLGHCVTSWSLRLNPIQAGEPLLVLPELSMRHPDMTQEDLIRKSFAASLGFDEAWDAVLALSECDGRIRIFSAVQWNGLKDAAPAPEGYIARWIQEWIETKEEYWLNRRQMFEGMIGSITHALEKLKPYADGSPVAQIWYEAGNLELRYLHLLAKLLIVPDKVSASDFEELDIACRYFFKKEETARAARIHVGLLLEPLIDFWRHPINLEG